MHYGTVNWVDVVGVWVTIAELGGSTNGFDPYPTLELPPGTAVYAAGNRVLLDQVGRIREDLVVLGLVG